MSSFGDDVSNITYPSGIVPISDGGTGRTTRSSAINNLLPDQTGQIGKFLATDGTNIEWAIGGGGGGSGTPNTFAGFDNAGLLESVPGFNIDTTTGGMNENFTQHPNNGGGFSQNNFTVGFEPLQDSVNENWNIQNYQIFLDDASSGFAQGTAGNALQAINVGINHNGTGNVGQLVFLNMGAAIGNGTDPITVNGLIFSAAFTNFSANTTLNGQLQGYTFVPNANSSAVFNNLVQGFSDGAQLPINLNGYFSANFSPNIGGINNNNGFSSINANPQIGTLIGNGSVVGLNFNPSITTFGTGGVAALIYNPVIPTMGATSYYHGVDLYGQIGTSHGSINGLNVQPIITGGDANFTGININPSGGASLGNVSGINIGLSNVGTIDPFGPTGINSDSRVQIQGTSSLGSSLNFQIGSRVSQLFHNLPGSPVTGTDAVGVDLAGDTWMQDNFANGPTAGIVGISSVAAAPQIIVSSGKTVDTFNALIVAAALPPPPSGTDGGTVTEFSLLKIAPPLPEGGSLLITNLYGLKIDDGLSSASPNAFSIFQKDPNAPNHFASDVQITTAGKGLQVKTGSNAKMGTSTLVGGTVTVSNTSVTANSRIFVTSQADGGTPGFLRVTSKVVGTSFNIVSGSILDTSTVAWIIIEGL